MPGSIRARYAEMARSGIIESDPAQQDAAMRLDDLRERLGEVRLAQKSSALGWLFSKPKVLERPRGLYIWGEVGRGKTMLMDLFFECVSVRRKRRVHFHSFMTQTHQRIFDWRQRHKRGEVKGDDPIAPVAADYAQEAWLLCFDEFSVTDIADAMILGRLFQALFAQGVVVVATSNVEPKNLYRDGLNRALFLPFIAMLTERMAVMKLEAPKDFRFEKGDVSDVWFAPDDEDARQRLDQRFAQLAGGEKGEPECVEVFGRKLTTPEAANGVARFGYAQLCQSPLGAADFVTLARAYHTVIVAGIPKLDFERRNEVKRFILLIDALYDMNVKLVASAAAPPNGLFEGAGPQEGGYGGAKTENFEFQRTLSRLTEMISQDYLRRSHGAQAEILGAPAGIAET